MAHSPLLASIYLQKYNYLHIYEPQKHTHLYLHLHTNMHKFEHRNVSLCLRISDGLSLFRDRISVFMLHLLAVAHDLPRAIPFPLLPHDGVAHPPCSARGTQRSLAYYCRTKAREERWKRRGVRGGREKEG